MKKTVKEGQIVIAGRVGSIEKKTDTLATVNVANRKGKDETEWITLSFANPKNGEGQKFADLALNFIDKGQYITAVCNEVKSGNYTNYYVVAVELGPKGNGNGGKKQK